jgi:hypothetical protein
MAQQQAPFLSCYVPSTRLGGSFSGCFVLRLAQRWSKDMTLTAVTGDHRSSLPGPDSISPDARFGIDLYWLPLGAGGNFVRFNGRVYEAIKARLDRRPVSDLYHSALQVFVPDGRYVVENTPVVDDRGRERGVVMEGPVGARWAGRLRLFRYEMRRWLDGVIPDISEAVDSPRQLSGDLSDARRLLELMPHIPALVWGRDELGAGEMWNSNSMISWLIASTGLDIDSIKPPAGGRAPGWNAGVVAARESGVAPRPALEAMLGGHSKTRI